MVFGNKFQVDGKLVVITGGSQGLGAELGRQLFAKGASVIIIARTESKLKSHIETIEKSRRNDKQTLSYRTADVSIYEECEKALDSIKPDIVILCAGSSIPKLFKDLSPVELQNGVDVNYKTALNFSHVAFKKMITTKVDYKRHLIFCSSVLGVYSFIGYGQYAPSKAAIRSLADVLRDEAVPYNIKVHTIFPGNFQSEGFIEEEKTKPEITKLIEGPSDPISVEKATAIVLWFLDKGYEMIYTDVIGWVLSSMAISFSPKVLGLIQAFLGLVLALVAPFYRIYTSYEIKKYFKKSDKSD